MLKDITIDDLYKPFDSYAQAIGIENLYKLSELTGGRRIYIPSSMNILKGYTKRLIAEEYWTTNITQEQLADIAFRKIITEDEKFEEIAEIVGKDKALKVIKIFSGLTIYWSCA